MRAFIVRPFGIKKIISKDKTGVDFDFDKVEKELIRPAMKEAGITGGTTAEIFEAGDIREDMFSDLLLADIVIADITIHNANVFYELGIRHALRDKITILIKCPGFDDTPFDVIGYRYQSYQRDKPADSQSQLVKALKESLQADRKDSPVFNILPELLPQDPDVFQALPIDFVEEVKIAKESKQIGKLSLLALEADFFDWKMKAWRLIGEAQFQLNQFEAAKAIWEKITTSKGNDLEANDRLATIYQRLAEQEMISNPSVGLSLLAQSDISIEIILDRYKELDSNKRAEAYSLRARNLKTRWLEEWKKLPPEESAIKALLSNHLEKSINDYETGFYENLNHFYSGINALGLLRVRIDLAIQNEQIWFDSFESNDAALDSLKKLKEKFQKLSVTIEISILAGKEKLKKLDRTNPWLDITQADYQCLISDNPNRVKTLYQKALQGVLDFNLDAVICQLKIYERLKVLTENVSAALSVMPFGKHQVIKQCILFSGHQIDKEGRPEPRFPSSKELMVKNEIKKHVEAIKNSVSGELVGLAGGACGCDILFHEVCKELGVKSELYLPLSKERFINESVSYAATNWQLRFNSIYDSTERKELSRFDALPKWLTKRESYSIWERNNLWLLYSALAFGSKYVRVIAVWDGKEGDGPDGTEHMVGIAKNAGTLVEIINIKKI